MQTRPFGQDGPPVGVIGQGTWQMEQRPREAVAALRHGVELGLHHVDTAEIYGDGAVERLVGQALSGRRDRVFLVSKIDPSRATRTEAARACEETLRRLDTDYLDAYLLHWLPPHPLEEAVEAMEELVTAGKVRRWGVSNFDEVKLGDAVAIAGPGRVACNQVLYHLEERTVEHRVLPACERHGVAAVGYSPFVVGRFPPGDSPGGQVLAQVAEAHGATPRQVALAFLVRLPGTLTIPRATTVSHVADNARAAQVELTAPQVRAVAEAFPVGQREWGVATL